MTAPRATSEALNSPVKSTERRALRFAIGALRRIAGAEPSFPSLHITTPLEEVMRDAAQVALDRIEELLK